MAITGKDQIVHGLEFTALAWRYHIKSHEQTLEQIAAVFAELLADGDEMPTLTLRNINNWKAKTEDFFGIGINLQQRSIVLEGREFELASFYLRSFADSVNDEALRLVFSAFARERAPSQVTDPMEIMYRLVHLRFAIRHGLLTEIRYAKLMANDQSRLRLIRPLAVQSLDGLLDLTALDIRSGHLRHLLLSRITAIESDLFTAWNGQRFADQGKAAVQPFEHGEYGNPVCDAVLELRGRSYIHFVHRFYVKHDIIASETGRVVIRLPGIGERRIRDIVFNYGEYCTLLEPAPLRERFAAIAEKIAGHHRRPDTNHGIATS
jgi:predicted DNA-binding transcriptional regulator YafY